MQHNYYFRAVFFFAPFAFLPEFFFFDPFLFFCSVLLKYLSLPSFSSSTSILFFLFAFFFALRSLCFRSFAFCAASNILSFFVLPYQAFLSSPVWNLPWPYLLLVSISRNLISSFAAVVLGSIIAFLSVIGLPC